MAEIARFKELQQILRSSDNVENLPVQGHELERDQGADACLKADGSPQRDSSKENVYINLGVFERLALRGSHEAMKIRRDSHNPFVTGTATTKNSASQVTLAYRAADHHAFKSLIISSCSSLVYYLEISISISISFHIEDI